MTTYLVHFTAIEWDLGEPEDGHDGSQLPSEYAVTVEARSLDDAWEAASDRMSDDIGFLFFGAQHTINVAKHFSSR